MNDLFTCTSKARSGSLSFYGPLFSVFVSLTLPGFRRERVGGVSGQWDYGAVKGDFVCAIGKL